MKKFLILSPVFLLLLVILIFAIVSTRKENKQESVNLGISNIGLKEENKVGKLAKPFMVKTASGQEISLESAKGKVVIVESYDPWCASCIYEGQQLAKAHSKYKENVVILGFSLNPLEDDESRKTYREQTSATWELIPNNEGKNTILDYQMTALSATVIINPSGIITYRDGTETDEATFEQEINKALKI